MATICTCYLTFDCFDPELAEDIFSARVLNGDLAFQEYAACNWIKHLKSLFETSAKETVIPESVQKAILILQERHGIQLAHSSELRLGRMCQTDFEQVLTELQHIYDQTYSILAEDSETGNTLIF